MVRAMNELVFGIAPGLSQAVAAVVTFLVVTRELVSWGIGCITGCAIRGSGTGSGHGLFV